MKKILITGISGFLGQHLAYEAKNQGYSVFGTYYNHVFTAKGLHSIPLDIADYTGFREAIERFSPDAVIHTAALSNANYCQDNPELSQLINVDASIEMAKVSQDLQIPFLFTSTDLVFDGQKGNYAEDDDTNPQMIYGEHKVMAEQGILAAYPQATICRMPLMFGYSETANRSFLSGFLKNISQGKSINLFYDEYRTPLDGNSAALGILFALKKNINGIIHLGGKERMSRYDWGMLMADTLHLDKSLIHRKSQGEFEFKAPRPADVSLNSEKAFNLGFDPDNNKKALISLQEKIQPWLNY